MVSLLFVVLSLVVCSRSARAQDMSELMKGLGAMLGGAGTNAPAALVDFRELKALLPAELEGMKRVEASGEKSGAMGMTIAFAEGRYEGADNASVTIKLSDISGLGGFGVMAQYGWASQEMDRETETGYERTTTISGHKAHEQYDSSAKSGQLDLMIKSRFMVELAGHGIADGVLQKAREKIDLQKLESLEAKPAS